jgi:hypothetical protein
MAHLLSGLIEERFKYYMDNLGINCFVEEDESGYEGSLSRLQVYGMEATEQTKGKFSTFYKLYVNNDQSIGEHHDISLKTDLSQFGDYVVIDRFKTDTGETAEMRFLTRKPVFFVAYYTDEQSDDNLHHFEIEEIAFIVGDVELWMQDEHGKFVRVDRAFASFEVRDVPKFDKLVPDAEVRPSQLVSSAILQRVKQELEQRLEEIEMFVNSAILSYEDDTEDEFADR